MADTPRIPRRPGACTVVFNDRRQILLHRRSDNGHWGLPGGNIEPEESLQQTVVREVQEETGYEVAVVRLVGVYSDPRHTTIRYPDGNTVAYVTACFECRIVGGQPTLSSESTAVDFFDPRNLPQPFMPNHLLRVTDALAAQVAAFYR